MFHLTKKPDTTMHHGANIPKQLDADDDKRRLELLLSGSPSYFRRIAYVTPELSPPYLSAALLCTGARCCCPRRLAAQDAAPRQGRHPRFHGARHGWTMINANATDYAPPTSGPRPVTNDPKYPHVGKSWSRDKRLSAWPT
jgi:hypothetical protein